MRSILGPAVEEFAPQVDALERTILIASRRQRNRRLAAGALALIISGAVGIGLWTAFRPAQQAMKPVVHPAGSDESLVSQWGGSLAWEPSGEGNELDLTTASSHETFNVSVQPGRPGHHLPTDLISTQSAVSPKGNAIITAAAPPVILKRGGQQLPVSGVIGTGIAPTWAPDGVRFSFEDCVSETTCTVRIASSVDGSSTGVAPSIGRGVSWSPDGERIAYIDPPGALSLIEVPSGSATRLVTPEEVVAGAPTLTGIPGNPYLMFPQWSPSGSYLSVIVEFVPSGGYAPVVLTSSGALVGVGDLTAFGPPDLVWRGGRDELVYAEGPKSGGFPLGEVSTLSVMKAPSWISSQLLALPAQPTLGVFSSPNGEVVVWQTLDEQEDQRRAGVGPPPMLWNVLDIEKELLLETKSTQQRILDWR